MNSYNYKLSKNDWNFIDHTYCINLDTRDDRLQDINKVFELLNIKGEVIRVKKHPTDGKIGCFESHRNIIRKSLKEGHKKILIFEDDATPVIKNINKEVLKNIENFTKINEQWNIFFLGYLPDIKNHTIKETSFNNIYKVNGLCTHAYIINHNMMKIMAEMPWIGIQIDYLFSKIDNCYAISPSLFTQGQSISDIHNNFWDKLPKPITEKIAPLFNNSITWYAHNINVPIYSSKFITSIIIATIITTTIFIKNNLNINSITKIFLSFILWAVLLFILLKLF